MSRRHALLGTLLLVPALLACEELLLPPELEAGGEPGPAIYTASGALQSRRDVARGSATYTLDDAGRAALALSADFRVPDAPRVFAILTDSGQIEDGVTVGRLLSTSGAHRWTFVVPRGAVWRWVLLWSEEARVEVARAQLEP
jgi:hypothetical protein